MQSLNSDLAHLVGDGVVSVAREPIDTCSQKEVGAGLIGYREQFVDVALAIADMDDTLRLGQQRCRLSHVLKPSVALLLFDRNTRGVDAALERVRAVELISGPELDRSQPEWKTVRSDNETGVHQDAAGRVMHGLALTTVRCCYFFQQTYRLRIIATVEEFGRIVKHKHRSIRRSGKALACADKMTGKDLFLIDPYVRKETISCLCSRPILTGKGNASTDLPRKLPKQGSEPLSVTDILKLAARHLAFKPTPNLLVQRRHARSSSDLHRN